MDGQIVRRDFLRTGGTALLATAAVVGCDSLSTEPKEKKQPGEGKAAKPGAKESPVLTAKVAAGNLPPLKERLPDEPLVVTPVDQVGKFGGTLRRGETSMQSPRNLFFLCRASLVEWGLDKVEPVPGLAKSWEIVDGGKTYRFVLRKGLKWSDGEPFTVDDLTFYGDGFLNNKEMTPVAPTWLRSGDQNVKIVKVDETTVDFQFAEPSSLLLRYLSFAPLGMSILVPAHYLKQFHPDYGSKKDIDAATKKAGLDSWVDYFVTKNDLWLNPDRPVLGAWMVTSPSTGSKNRAVLDRNPYYWKVDTEGNQLPYIDKLDINGVDAATATLQAAQGQIDLQTTYISVNNMPVLAKNEKQAHYKVLNWGTGSGPYLYTSQSHEDPVIRKLMQNIDFRAALSHAIDRDEMNKLFYHGLGNTMQPVCLPEDPYHVAGSGHTFVEHDPAKANSLLDKVGLTKRDGDGFRLRPDGKPMLLTISTFAFETGVDSVDAYTLVKKYWQKVGLRTKVDNMDSSLWVTRVTAGKYDVAGYDMGRYMWDVDALWYVPIASTTYWAPLFGLWYQSAGQDGEKPPPIFKKMQDMYDQLKSATDDETRLSIGKAIQSLHDKNVWVIGTVRAPFQPVVVNDDLTNVVQKRINDYRTGYTQLTWPEQVSYQHPDEN